MVMPGRYGLVKSVITDDDLEAETDAAMGGADLNSIREGIVQERELKIGEIVSGIVRRYDGDDIVIDLNYKAEGFVPKSEFEAEHLPLPVIGEKIEVLLDEIDNNTLILSKRKADRIRGWEKIINERNIGDVITGKAVRKIKGGLLVDIGVPVFLPASQVDIRRVNDVGEYIGRDLQCKIIKIDRERRNIVLSRRKLLEEERDVKKGDVLKTLVKGEIRKGVVKNITDFGAFVDLGGIDGLLHITDLSWGRVSHPSEVVGMDQELTVKVLDFDPVRERISLGLKQITPNPWDSIGDKYPINGRFKGPVVNIMPYGAFVKLEDGIEGLVHISEMSWTKQISHPSEKVAIGEEVEVVILDINRDKQELSLGMKQIEGNPWIDVVEKYPAGCYITGRVRNMTNYGAFVELEEGIDGLLHVNDMSWTKKINHPSALFRKGDEVRTVVLSVDPERRRVALGLKQMTEDPWQSLVPAKFHNGDIIEGIVTKLTAFGAFVEIDKDLELEGLLHISELSESKKIDKPEEVVKVGQRVTVMVINVDADERKVGLSLRATHEVDEEFAKRQKAAEEAAAAAQSEAENK
ncbi:MAG: 30S ribosomal protein S1 [Planctomycetota bacterium]|nr:30S ribosomal protein S1 [Planctomycetota bacterium]